MAIGSSGRRANGTFGPNNNAGRGGDHVSIKRGLELKDAFMAAVTPEDMRKIAKRLLDIALNGEAKHAIAAAHELFNRLIGKPSELVASETQNHFGQMLVTNAADALKYINEQSDDDPMRGIKCLPAANGK